jgi:hypothetical protein
MKDVMQNTGKIVPPPWGEDMEAALIAQHEAPLRHTEAVDRRRRRTRIPIVTASIVGAAAAFFLVWFLDIASSG